jgi:plasmid segregation protein ParM
LSYNAGIDVGFGGVKARSAPIKLDYCSVVGEFAPVKFSSGMEGATDPTQSIAIEYNNKRWYVGPAALKQTTPRATIEQNRTVTEEGQVLLLSALGLLSRESQANLVVGLPVMHYSDLKDQYIQQASGTHIFNYLTLTGEIKEKRAISIKNVKVLPQPFGTVFDTILDDEGKPKDKRLAAKNIGVIDIGYNTLDLLRADALQYINKRSTSFSEMGMFSAYRELSNLLFHEFKVEIPPEKLEPIVQRGILSLHGRNHPIEMYKRKAFQATADSIISRIKSIWTDAWQLDTIVLAGGGSIVLGDYLLGNSDFPQMELSSDPLYSNVNGYYKCACVTWGR